LNEERDDPTPPERPDPSRLETRLIVTHTSFVGPLPPPVILEQFERIAPGAANRILAFAEDQFRHRRSIEAQIVNSRTRAMSRGQWLAFVVLIVGMGLGAWLIRAGFGLYGFGSIIAPLATAAGLFMLTRRRQVRERELKRKKLADR